ncbi:hypothetical protein Agub_g16064, partial [Astrephomene gubernaculifera]
SRLSRELERVTEERDRARDDAKRAEQQRQQLDSELKELRKTSHQQMREASVTQSEAVRLLTEDKIAADGKIAGLQEKIERLDKTRILQDKALKESEEEAQLLGAQVDRLTGALSAKEATSAMQQE